MPVPKTTEEADDRVRRYARMMVPGTTSEAACAACGLFFRLGIDVVYEVAVSNMIIDIVEQDRAIAYEIDGPEHDSDKDRRRDHWLRHRGLRVVRLTNDLVLTDPDAAMERIREARGKPDLPRMDPWLRIAIRNDMIKSKVKPGKAWRKARGYGKNKARAGAVQEPISAADLERFTRERLMRLGD